MAAAEVASNVNGEPAAEDAKRDVDMSTEQAQAHSISADEIALYDRQIRLWGVQAQEKIQTANVLLIKAKALANEVAKNLVLAGIGSLTVVDHDVVTEEDLGSQFFVSEEHVGKNRAEAAVPQIQKLNPRVKVLASTEVVNALTPDFYAPFNLVIATDLDFPTFSNVNAITRICNKPFYAAGTHGMYGFIFSDLIMHHFSIERAKSNVSTVLGPESTMRSILSATEKKENGKTIELVTKQELYSPLLLANSSPLPVEITSSLRKMRNVTPLLPCLRALWDFEKMSAGALPNRSRQHLETFTRLATEKVRELSLPPDMLKSEFLRSFLQNLGSEIAPATAFLGGMLAQDVINVLGQREQPIQNLVLFDGEDSKGTIYALHPEFDASMAMGSINGLGMPMGDIGADMAGNPMMPMDLNAFGGLPMDGAGLMSLDGLHGMNGMDMDPLIGVDGNGMMLMQMQEGASNDQAAPATTETSNTAEASSAPAGVTAPPEQPALAPQPDQPAPVADDSKAATAAGPESDQPAPDGREAAAQGEQTKAPEPEATPL